MFSTSLFTLKNKIYQNKNHTSTLLTGLVQRFRQSFLVFNRRRFDHFVKLLVHLNEKLTLSRKITTISSLALCPSTYEITEFNKFTRRQEHVSVNYVEYWDSGRWWSKGRWSRKHDKRNVLESMPESWYPSHKPLQDFRSWRGLIESFYFSTWRCH